MKRAYLVCLEEELPFPSGRCLETYLAKQMDNTRLRWLLVGIKKVEGQEAIPI